MNKAGFTIPKQAQKSHGIPTYINYVDFSYKQSNRDPETNHFKNPPSIPYKVID